MLGLVMAMGGSVAARCFIARRTCLETETLKQWSWPRQPMSTWMGRVLTLVIASTDCARGACQQDVRCTIPRFGCTEKIRGDDKTGLMLALGSTGSKIGLCAQLPIALPGRLASRVRETSFRRPAALSAMPEPQGVDSHDGHAARGVARDVKGTFWGRARSSRSYDFRGLRDFLVFLRRWNRRCHRRSAALSRRSRRMRHWICRALHRACRKGRQIRPRRHRTCPMNLRQAIGTAVHFGPGIDPNSTRISADRDCICHTGGRRFAGDFDPIFHSAHIVRSVKRCQSISAHCGRQT